MTKLFPMGYASLGFWYCKQSILGNFLATGRAYPVSPGNNALKRFFHLMQPRFQIILFGDVDRILLDFAGVGFFIIAQIGKFGMEIMTVLAIVRYSAKQFL